MKEQLISFETAKLAKEKGFTQKGIYPKWRVDGKILVELTNGDEEYHSASTQSLLQKWLREEHNIHILMNVGMYDGNKQTFYCNVCLFGENLYKSKFRSKTSIYTYEEALEEGLQEALKLI